MTAGAARAAEADDVEDALLRGLRVWAEARWRGDVSVVDVSDLGGHSGKTVGFTVSAGGARTSLVIRVAPAGVAHRGSTDVLRQAPLLRALETAKVSVAAVRDASDDPTLFGAPFLVVDRLPGRPLMMGPDYEPSWLDDHARSRAFPLAVRELARLHAVDHRSALSGWEAEKTPREEIDFWLSILHRSPEPDWTRAGLALRDRLLERYPTGFTVGVCHGDFQTNNILFTGDADTLAIGGVVDWELAHIGAVELDLAWFFMMNDPAAWDPVELRGGLDFATVLAHYEACADRQTQHLDWFWALACYRMAAVACYNIRLHRSGRRPDQAWERAASSVPCYFRRANAILDGIE